ncbi:MAG: hypothetical protein ABFQ53_00700 [Patescibacteria group bacterium]
MDWIGIVVNVCIDVFTAVVIAFVCAFVILPKILKGVLENMLREGSFGEKTARKEDVSVASLEIYAKTIFQKACERLEWQMSQQGCIKDGHERNIQDIYIATEKYTDNFQKDVLFHCEQGMQRLISLEVIQENLFVKAEFFRVCSIVRRFANEKLDLEKVEREYDRAHRILNCLFDIN